jgi:predicted NUDIX family NTP pyrophosphohydrolase
VAHSAGLLLFRLTTDLEVLLVHPGGPYWATKDEGVWSIPKGEYDPDRDDALETALREFREETGSDAPAGDPIDLGEVTQKAGKVVRALAMEGDLDAGAVESNTFAMEWPPRSGITREFPEVDRAGWFDSSEARLKLNPSQAEFVDRLVEALRPS